MLAGEEPEAGKGKVMKEKSWLCWLLIVFAAIMAQAQTDATVIVTAVVAAFALVASACISIGTFFVVYRLVKRVK